MPISTSAAIDFPCGLRTRTGVIKAIPHSNMKTLRKISKAVAVILSRKRNTNGTTSDDEVIGKPQ